MRTYTADDEEPNCGQCDNICSDYVCNKCGPDYGWNNYSRTEQGLSKEEHFRLLKTYLEGLYGLFSNRSKE